MALNLETTVCHVEDEIYILNFFSFTKNIHNFLLPLLNVEMMAGSTNNVINQMYFIFVNEFIFYVTKKILFIN